MNIKSVFDFYKLKKVEPENLYLTMYKIEYTMEILFFA